MCTTIESTAMFNGIVAEREGHISLPVEYDTWLDNSERKQVENKPTQQTKLYY
eukprot:m.352327 g.352327  ORF g.352327 m.352327 type:complete len:53 (-) comp16488_c0_seq1:1731-1889(-)